MKLLTKEIKKALPALYATDGVKVSPVVVKFFCPWNSWTWYAIEGSPTCPECGAFDCSESEGHGEKTDFTFFGLVEGHEKELGYFQLAELEGVTGIGGLKIERDLYFSGYVLDKTTNTVKRPDPK